MILWWGEGADAPTGNPLSTYSVRGNPQSTGPPTAKIAVCPFNAGHSLQGTISDGVWPGS